MPSISVKEFLFWKKIQLSKGGDHQSLALLLDSVGGISNSDLNLSKINSGDNILKFRLKNARKLDRKALNLLRNQEIQAIIN